MLSDSLRVLLNRFKYLFLPSLRVMATMLTILVGTYSSSTIAKPQFDGSNLTLPELQVGADILTLVLDLTDPEALIFQVDFSSVELVSAQSQAACDNPYFSFAQNQLIIPVLEVGGERYQVFLDLLDVDQGLFQVNLVSPLMTTVVNPAAPALSVWQSGTSIAAEWGSPGDEVDGYLVWFTPYQGGEIMVAEDVGSLTSISAELPAGVDFCLTVTSYGTNGDSEFSSFERFTNLEVPFSAYNTDDASLPTLFFPALNDKLSLALMHNAGDDVPYGAAIRHADRDTNLIVTYHPESGLLSRLTLGDVAFHFVNYTPTTVDVIESEPGGETRVHPDLPLTNHAITVINQLIAAFEASQQPLILLTEISAESLQRADWAKKALELGRDILLTVDLENGSPGSALLDELIDAVTGFHGDVYSSVPGETTQEALEAAQQALDAHIENFGCAGEPGLSCAAYGGLQADLQAFIDSFPDTAEEQFQQLLDTLSEAEELREDLNQDCLTIQDPGDQQACLNLQGDPEPGEQEELLLINDSQAEAAQDEINALTQATDQAANTMAAIVIDETQRVLTLNQLYFEYQELIGQNVWVLGFYGNLNHNNDGYAFLVDEYDELLNSNQLQAESFARLDGLLPPADWDSAEILVYGEVKDFATESGLPSELPTPLITVSAYEQVTPPEPFPTGDPLVFQSLNQAMTTPGTQASACDRAVIISGGLDASNNHDRYPEAVKKMHEKLIALGFSKDQIDVFYYDGSALNSGGSNIVDSAATKAAILAKLAALKQQMQGSCTLTIFVSDHGTGYSEEEGYRGARPAFEGHDATDGMLYDENKFKVNATRKTWLKGNRFTFNGNVLLVNKLADGTYEIFLREGGQWKFKASKKPDDPANPGTSGISESEMDVDLDGDGMKKPDRGIRFTELDTKLGTTRDYGKNEWDTDGDGTVDVRVRWDGNRFVIERLVGSEWKEMGRDTNGDYMIDENDGGVDWNLDGDKDDKVGFHEGINLFGKEVLWDNELVDALRMLDDMNVHIAMQMSSCFSGGFVAELEGIVEYILAASREDSFNWSRRVAGGGFAMLDQLAFFDNLLGIDVDSLMHAGMKSKEIDDAAAGTGIKNDFLVYKLPKFDSQSVFEEESPGVYKIDLDIPDELALDVFDFEIFFGLQKPRWDANLFELVGELPEGLEVVGIDGGFKVVSSDLLIPIIDNVKFRIKGPDGVQMMRFELTDIFHNVIGQTMAMPGEVEFLEKFESGSIFEVTSPSQLEIELDIPDTLLGEVYDFEVYFGDQQPPWTGPITALESALPPGISADPIIPEGETAAVGLKFVSTSGNAIPDGFQFILESSDIFNGTEMLRIELTDISHDTLGFVMAMPAQVDIVPKIATSSSVFELDPLIAGLNLQLDIPPELENQVFDFEIFYDQQDPPLPPISLFPDFDGLPPEVEVHPTAGGLHFVSSNPLVPLPDDLVIPLIAPDYSPTMLRIELTNQQHDPLGWVMAMPGTVPLPSSSVLNPGLHMWFMVDWVGTPLPADPLVLNPDGSALLGQPPPFPGNWDQNGTLSFEFGGGLTPMDLLMPPIPPSLCFTGGQGQHFGFPTTEGTVCPVGHQPEVLLQDERFQVEVEWQDFSSSGTGLGLPMTQGTGAFYFFDPNNWEVLIKVLDGCQFNDHFWVFAAATTDVEFTLTVTDTLTSEEQTISNPLGSPFQPITDTQAFATCP